MKKLKGKKTFISGGIVILLLIVAYFQGWDERKIQEIIGFGIVAMGICIRLGIADSLGISKEDQATTQEEAQKAQKILKHATGTLTTIHRLSAKEHTPTIAEIGQLVSAMSLDGPLGGMTIDESKEIKKNLTELIKDYSKKPQASPADVSALGEWTVNDLKKFSAGP